jgi:hypothetical protein
MPFKTPRAWLLYASAWPPYTVSYYLIFRIRDSTSRYALADAIINVLPAALLGIGVLAAAHPSGLSTLTTRAAAQREKCRHSPFCTFPHGTASSIHVREHFYI